MKCCGNCFWSFTEQDELDLESYDEEDINKPQAGDCLIGQTHDDNFYCSQHQYIEGLEEYKNYVIYDDSFWGIGYLIVSTLDNKILKFIKISEFGENGFPQYLLRAYEFGSIDKPDEEYRNIIITANDDEPLYKAIKNFALNTNKEQLFTIDSSNQVKSEYGIFSSSLIISKDTYGVKNTTDYIEILIKDNDTCKNYIAFKKFYDELSQIALLNSKEEIKKILKYY